jgi:ABC-type multidrug transport system fused ATPase/permease subunit
MVLAILAVVVEGVGIIAILPIVVEQAITGGNDHSFNLITHKISVSLGFSTFFISLIIFILIFYIKGIIIFCSHYYTSKICKRYTDKIRYELLTRSMNIKLSSWYSEVSEAFGETVNQQTNSAVAALKAIVQLSAHVTTIFIYILLIIAFSGVHVISFIIIAFLLFIAFRKLNQSVLNLSKNAVEKFTDLNLALIEIVKNYKYLKATNTTKFKTEKALDIGNDASSIVRKFGIYQGITISLKEPVIVSLIALTILWRVYFVQDEAGNVIIFLIAQYKLLTSLFGLQSLMQGFLQNYGSMLKIEELFEVIKLNGEVSGSENKHSLERDIKFNHVSLHLNNNVRKILNDVNVIIPANRTTAVIGQSGSGKTTIADMICGLYMPADGDIYIGEVNLKNLDLRHWRNRIGYVMQTSEVFHDTVEDNILGDINRDLPDLHERMQEALVLSGLVDIVASLPDGIQTFLGGKGVQLSGGQKQRVLIARELIKKPEILILDEATSALDKLTESHLVENLKSLDGKITCVIITHNIENVKHVEQIIVMDHGKIIDVGTHRSLSKSISSYM